MRIQMPTGVSWAATCVLSPATVPAVPLMDTAYVLVDERLEVNGARQRDVQRVQVEQGRQAFSGISTPAPAAHKIANVGETGPYPWRQPV